MIYDMTNPANYMNPADPINQVNPISPHNKNLRPESDAAVGSHSSTRTKVQPETIAVTAEEAKQIDFEFQASNVAWGLFLVLALLWLGLLISKDLGRR